MMKESEGLDHEGDGGVKDDFLRLGLQRSAEKYNSGSGNNMYAG